VMCDDPLGGFGGRENVAADDRDRGGSIPFRNVPVPGAVEDAL
jgi:hypothetical protein